MRETAPSDRTSLISSLMPTRNSNTAMPSSDRSPIWASDRTTSNAEGPAIRPTAMKLTISGWRRMMPIKPIMAAMTSRAATSPKADWAMSSVNRPFLCQWLSISRLRLHPVPDDQRLPCPFRYGCVVGLRVAEGSRRSLRVRCASRDRRRWRVTRRP